MCRCNLMSSGTQVLEQVGASPHQAQHLRGLFVGLRVAPGHLPSGTPFERGMAFHVHGVLLRPRRVLRCLDVHHQLHAAWLFEHLGPRNSGMAIVSIPTCTRALAASSLCFLCVYYSRHAHTSHTSDSGQPYAV